MLLWLIRVAFVALLLVMAFLAVVPALAENPPAEGVLTPVAAGIVTPLLILLVGGVVMLTDIREKQKQVTTLSALYFGLILGLLLGWLFTIPLDPILKAGLGEHSPIIHAVKVSIALICTYVTVSTLVQTKDEFRFIIPYVEFSKQVKGGRPLVLDTSVIIDGRIADVCDTKLIDSKLVVPRFVLQELQGIADSSDKLKRNRGRRGLDVLKRLQTNPKIELQMHDGNVSELRTGERIRVDERLVLFTKAIGGRVVTNDFNLNKVAQLQGVDVINLNEVANSLKTVALPGENLAVRVVKAGDQPFQGVGYLDDGTMVVIEQGRPLIGQEVPIVVTSVLQTPAGRMIFGRPDQRQSGAHTPPAGVGNTPAAPGEAAKGPDAGKG